MEQEIPFEQVYVKYLNVYPELPIDAPIGCPHIVENEFRDHSCPDYQEMSIADAVVTILYMFMPGALTAFLNLDCPNFHYIQAGQTGGGRLDFCIKRDWRTVGFLSEKELGGWDDQHKYHIDGAATERWTPISFRSCHRYGIQGREEMLREASGRAFMMLKHRPWRTDLRDQPVELCCGLSNGRMF